jgi:uncharacterized protein with PQ loop repeat
MLTKESIKLVGTLASGLSIVGLIPQLIRIVSRKEADDYSWYSLGIGIMKCFLWIFYGIAMNLYPIIIYFVFMLFYLGTISYVKWAYKKINTKENTSWAI